MKGYRQGLAMRCIRLLQRVFFLKRWAINFAEKKQETLQRIDDQIAELHSKHRVTFYTSLGAEFLRGFYHVLRFILYYRFLQIRLAIGIVF